jgi:hypothetical protein
LWRASNQAAFGGAAQAPAAAYISQSYLAARLRRASFMREATPHRPFWLSGPAKL